MFTPWSSFSACLLAKSDRIGGDRLDLVNQAHVNPLGLEVHRGSGGVTPWNQNLFHWGPLPLALPKSAIPNSFCSLPSAPLAKPRICLFFLTIFFLTFKFNLDNILACKLAG